MRDRKALIDEMNATCIEYSSEPDEPAISGSPFTVEFAEELSPEELANRISQPEDPWYCFGVPLPIGDSYWKMSGTLFHIDSNGEKTLEGSSEFTVEIAPEWMRVYVNEGSSPKRIADFLETLDEYYEFEVKFVDD